MFAKEGSAMHIGGTPLTRQLEAFRAGLLARLPASDRLAVLSAAEDLRANRDGRKSPDVGEPAPDFALPDQHGRIVRLADRLAHGPAVVLFIRGGWCPFCTLTLRAYQDALPAMEAAGAHLLAITPQQEGSCSAVAERDLLAFPVLSDQCNEIAGRYGVAYELAPALRTLYARLGHDLPRLNRTGDWRVPLPATFIIDAKGLVVRAHVEPVAHRRLEPAEVVRSLQNLTAWTPRVDA
jgi:peroxiredoxin